MTQLIKNSTLIAFLLWAVPACSGTSEPIDLEEEKDTEESQEPTLGQLEMVQVTNTSAIIESKVLDNGGKSVLERGVCYLKGEGTPTVDDQIKEASSVKGDGTFSTAINGLQDGQQYSARAYAINEVGVGYGEKGTFDTPSADRPEVRTGTDYVAGVDRIYVSVSLDGDGGFPITEKGICWSAENPAPTIDDELVEAGEGQDDFFALIKGLQTNETYYVRGYAKNDKGMGYGTTLEVRTLEMGNITYTLHGDIEPEIYDRIKGAFDEAVDYYNRYTNIEKHLNVYYNPGVPTADGNFNGTIRIGPNPSYQRTGTAMHEIAHVVGVGQHWKWNELIQDGKYTGQRGNRILQLLTGDPDAYIKGDGLHFWPYGINGAHEDNGDPELYIRHALLVQGMKTDGLPDK